MSTLVEVASHVVPGSVVAPIAMYSPEGERVDALGAYYHEGHIADDEGISLAGVHMGVATRKVNEHASEQAVVVLQDDKTPGVAEVDILTLTPRADGLVEPDLAAGALAVTMQENDIATAKLAKAGAHITGKFAERMGFKKDETTGTYVFRTSRPKVKPQAIAW